MRRVYALLAACVCVNLSLAASAYAETGERSWSLAFQVEAKAEDCLYQDIEVDSKVRSSVLISRGGKLNVKYSVRGPDEVVMYEKVVFANVNDETGAVMPTIMKKHFDFVAHQTGKYTFCFDNGMTNWAGKVVDFDLSIEPPPDSDGPAPIASAEPGKPATLGGMERRVTYLDNMLSKVSREQHYHRRRIEANKSTVESSNTRVMWFAILESVVLIGASIAQMYIIRAWFPANAAPSGV